jgi:hypothetical protein
MPRMSTLDGITPGARLGPWRILRVPVRGLHTRHAEVFGESDAPAPGEARLEAWAAPDAAAAQERAAEAVRLLDLDVPGCIGPLDAGALDELAWVVRPVPPGVGLDELQTPPGPARAAQVRAIGAAAAEALARLHEDGLVHGGLSPEHLRVDEAGLCGLAGLGEDPRGRPGSASAAHLAPELARGGRPGPAADVYALGMVLLEALTSGPRAGETTAPVGGGAVEPAPAAILRAPGVDLHLSAAIDAALAFHPAARPSAAALARALQRSSGAPPALPGCPVTVGRAAEIDALVRRLRASGPSLLLLAGPAGSGRHRLAEAAARRAQRDGVGAAWAVAHPRRPGAAVESVLQQLLAATPDPAAALGDDGPLLWALWPDLPGTGQGQIGGTDASALISACLRVMRRAIAARPLLIVLDALENADPLTLRFAGRAARQGGPNVHVIGILDDRSPPAPVRRWRRKLEEAGLVQVLGLPDLTDAEATELARRLHPSAGPVPGGSPQRAAEAGQEALCRALHIELRRPPLFALPLALAEAPLPPGVAVALGIPVELGLHQGWLEADGAGDLRLAPAHAPWARARIDRQAPLHDALADAWATSGAPAARAEEAAHRLRGRAPDLARGAVLRAGHAALVEGSPGQARAWALIADQLPRPRDTPHEERLLAATLRAELALRDTRNPLRVELVDQVRRRAHGQADLALAELLEATADWRRGDPDAAIRRWSALARDPATPPELRARAAGLWGRAALVAGRHAEVPAVLALGRRAAAAAGTPRARLHVAAVELDLAEAEGRAREVIDGALSAIEAAQEGGRAELVGARRLARGWAWRGLDDLPAALDDARAAHAAAAPGASGDPLRARARVLQATLALDLGAAARARRLLREVHPLLGPLADAELLGRWWAAALRLAVLGDDRPGVQGLLAAPCFGSSPVSTLGSAAAILLALRALRRPDKAQALLAGAVGLDHPTAVAADVRCEAALALIDADPRAAAAHARAAHGLAQEAGAPERTLRARLLLGALTEPDDHRGAWLTERARASTRLDLRVDAELLQARAADRRGDRPAALDARQRLDQLGRRSRCPGLRSLLPPG